MQAYDFVVLVSKISQKLSFNVSLVDESAVVRELSPKNRHLFQRSLKGYT